MGTNSFALSFAVKPRILVIRFSSIGDIVLTSPVVRTLKLQLDAEVHYLTKSAYVSILETNPYVDHIHTLEDDLDLVISQLKRFDFSHIVDLHNNIRTWRVKQALGGAHTQLNKLNWQKWLLVNTKVNRMPEVHIVDRYLDTVRSLGVFNDGKGLDYFVPRREEVSVKRLVKELTGEHIRWRSGFTALAIGAAHATKRMPYELLESICRGVHGPIMILGGPGDIEVGAALEAATRSEVVNLSGQLSLHGSASVVAQSSMVVTPDTGMMHIAAAFKKPIVSVWGNTVPAFGMYPYYPEGMDQHVAFEVPDLSCRPCSKIGFASCPKKHFRCMRDQSVDLIVQAANQRFEEV